MNKPILLLLAPMLLLPSLLHAEANRIIAAVNGRPVLESELRELNHTREMEVRRRIPDPKEAEAELQKVRRESLDNLIEQELIMKEYEPYKANFDAKVKNYAEEAVKNRFIAKMFNGDRERFLKELANSGISYRKFFEIQKKNVIAEMMRGQFARPDSAVITEEEKNSYLQKHADDFRTGGKVKLWAITIPGAAEGATVEGQLQLAKEIRTKLSKGDDFASLARTYSQDFKREEGGNRGWLEKKDLPPPMWAIVSKQKTGTISDVTPFAGDFYIFWVEATQPGQMRPAEEVDAEVIRRIEGERRKVASDAWIDKLKKKANIEIK